MNVFVLPDIEEQVEVLLEEGVIVLEWQPKERKRVDERTASDDHLGAALRKKVERSELLEQPNGIHGTEYRDGAVETDLIRSRGGGSKYYRRRRIEVLAAVMFADAERVESSLIGMLDLFDELTDSLGRRHRETRIVVGRGKAINSDLQDVAPCCSVAKVVRPVRSSESSGGGRRPRGSSA